MTATLLRILASLAIAAPASALAARSDWSPAGQSQLRLLLSPPVNRRVEGGIEIALDPGWHTYWRNPGEVGVPPVFDFAGSRNVADVEVLYPAPERFEDGASTSLIYRDAIVFPLNVTPQNTGEPVTLQVQASFGVCREICIPTTTDSEVTLEPSAEPDPLARALLARFKPRVPKAPEPGRFDVQNVTVDDTSLLVDVLTPESSYVDLFAEGPPGWTIGQPKLLSRADGIARFRLDLPARSPEGAETPQQFRFTAVAGGEAIEEAVEVR